MKSKSVLTALLLLIFFLMAQGALWGQDKRSKLLKAGENKPIDIVSDRLDAYQEKDLVQFSGNVIANQGERVIKSDILMVYFKKKAENKKAESKKAEKKEAGDGGDGKGHGYRPDRGERKCEDFR